MKKVKLFTLLGLGVLGLGALSFGIAKGQPQYMPVRAEGDEPTEPVSTPTDEEVFECSVVIDETKNGTIKVDKTEGHIGDLVTITASHDLFYKIDSISVNGTSLVEDEEISGKFVFALVEGENKIEGKFVVDKELLGEMSIIYEQLMNKDWTHLFSVENVVRIVTFLLNGGLLFAIIRYYVKDKKLEKKLEETTESTLNKIVPETTKQVIIENTKEVLAPFFAEITANQEENLRVSASLTKCLALMQEDTPESRLAVLNELSQLNVGDKKLIEEAKEIINKYFADKITELNNVLAGLDKIIEKNKEVVEKTAQVEQPKAEEKVETAAVENDGTQF